MRFRKKMIMAYALVAIVSGIITGVTVFWLSYTHAVKVEKKNLSVAADQLVDQMDGKLALMDASMNYVLSNMDMLNAIEILGRDKATVKESLRVTAKATIRKNINTDFIQRNCYRIVYFNRNKDLIGSVSTRNSRLAESFCADEIPYLSAADEEHGHSIMVYSRKDPWVTNEDAPKVYSMVKAIQGSNRGYLEVENLVSDISNLSISTNRIQYAVYINDRDCIGKSRKMRSEVDYIPFLTKNTGKIIEKEGNWFTVSHSDKYNICVLAVEKDDGTVTEAKKIIGMSILIGSMIFIFEMILVLLWSNILTMPIRRLINVIDHTDLQTLNNNNLPSSIQKETEKDELQQLTDSYQMMTKRLHDAILKEQKASMLQLQSLYDSLQAQVNPHFIYNVLNIISARGVMDDDDMICEICGALASILRYSTGTQRRYVTLDEELEYMRNYYYLLRARFGERLHFHFCIEDSIRKVEIPKALIQQIVENSVVHGFRDSTSSMEIDICGKLQGDRCILQIRDNGSGIEKEALEKIHFRFKEIRTKLLEEHENIRLEIGGMGLVNAFARCLLLYERELEFDINNREDCSGVVTRISFPASRVKGGKEDV